MALRSGDWPHVVVAMGCASAALGELGCYRVPEGKSAVASISIEGPSAGDADAVAERIATRASQRFLGLFPGVFFEYETFDRFALRRDLARIERYLRARGFYDARVRAARVTPDGDEVHVTIEVDPGAPVKVADVVITGDSGLTPDTREAVRDAATSGLPRGSHLDERRYVATEEAVRRALTVRGHARAKVTRRAEVDLATQTARVTFAVDAGPVAALGPITFVGLEALSEGAVRRVFGVREGDPFSSAELERSREALLDLGVFASVEVEPDLSAAETTNVVPVTIRTSPSQLHVVSVGGGIQFDQLKTDVHALVGWQSANFLGGLRRFDARFKPGTVLFPTRLPTIEKPEALLYEHRLAATLRQPALFEKRTTGVLTAEYNLYPVLLPGELQGEVVPGYHEIRAQTGVERKFGPLFVSPEYGIQWNTPIEYLGTSELLHLLISYVEVSSFLDLRDDPVKPRRGSYLGTQFQVAGGPLGGDADDTRMQPEVRFYVPLPKKMVFAVRGSVGLLFPRTYGAAAEASATGAAVNQDQLSRDAQILFFRGFFSGGPTSNRGYPLRGIAPTAQVSRLSPAGQSIAASVCPETTLLCDLPIGGRSLWEASAELRVPVSGPFSSALFCDTSDVSPKELDFRFATPHLSCGAGARYDTPVGPIRVDAAYRFADEGRFGTIFGAPIGVAFGIGEAF